MGCVALRKLLNLSELQLPCLKNEYITLAHRALMKFKWHSASEGWEQRWTHRVSWREMGSISCPILPPWCLRTYLHLVSYLAAILHGVPVLWYNFDKLSANSQESSNSLCSASVAITSCSKPPGRSPQLLGSLKLLLRPYWTMSSYVWANKEEIAFVREKLRYTSLTLGALVRPLDMRKLLSFPEMTSLLPIYTHMQDFLGASHPCNSYKVGGK